MTMGSDSRGDARVRVLAVHTTEGMMRAIDLRNWTGWQGSSHASADQDGVLLTPADGFVPYDRAAWTLRSGNAWSENIELCAWARYTRPEWLARPKLLAACARWLADRSKARGIPLVKLTPAQYRAGGSGVIGHVDHTVGYRDGTHTDPGPAFPYDVVLPMAQAILNSTQGDELSAQFEAEARAALADLANKIGGLQYIAVSKDAGAQGELLDRVRSIDAGVAAILAQAPGGQVDASTIAAAIPGNLAKQVADELTKRLAD